MVLYRIVELVVNGVIELVFGVLDRVALALGCDVDEINKNKGDKNGKN